MTPVIEFATSDWDKQCPPAVQERALSMLEEGNVLYFPQLRFSLDAMESRFLSPSVMGKSKNVSFDISTGNLRGSSIGEEETKLLKAMMRRYADSTRDLVVNLLPRYEASLVQARTSFRPVEIAERSTSRRKDDTRLHVDSFPSTPVQDKRILRVFTNMNPHGQNRSWRIGESFDRAAAHFLSSLSRPVWGVSRLLQLSGITKSRRSPYDHFMLQMHDHMKADLKYQAEVEQIAYDFPPGSTWIAFTDQVSHAAMHGQHMLEQTFYLPVASMLEPSRAPLRVLERLMGQELL